MCKRFGPAWVEHFVAAAADCDAPTIEPIRQMVNYSPFARSAVNVGMVLKYWGRPKHLNLPQDDNGPLS
jgi:hypothetical protein